MTELIFKDHVDVKLISHMGDDASVVAAARVSTEGLQSLEYLDGGEGEGRGLINFLMKNRHGTPFEHNAMTFFVSAPIFVFREFHRHRIGWCLAGDTEVWGETISEGCGRTINRRTIADIYDRWHNGVTDVNGRTRHLPACRNFTVRTLDETTGKFILSRVVDVYENGVKPVVKMSTDHGESIRATTDHAVWTPEGWAKIGDLEVGDLVARNGKVPINPTRQYPPALRAGIGVWTSMQRQDQIKPVDTCYLCGDVFDFRDLELDHVIPVVQDLKLALDSDNLAPACRPCHRVKSDGEQSLATRGATAGVKWTAITSVIPDGEELTYDIELEGPNRGFVANGLVVHNSYNEESGRYTQLKPAFYIPNRERNLQQIGKTGAYEFVPGTDEQFEIMSEGHKEVCRVSYENYERQLDVGIAKEVARMSLPVNIFSSMYATCNARSLMAFLGLRTNRPDATFPSKPQREIEMVAEFFEFDFARLLPLVHETFEANGRVCP